MKRRLVTIAALLILPALWAAGPGASNVPAPAERAVPRTHSHNDYEHEHPLLDALHHGFVGVEADVYLVGTELRVSHAPARDWAAVPTLQAAYLTPLSDLKTKHHNGGVYADGTPVLLLVDIKTGADATYGRVHEVLAEYEAANPGLFTACTKEADGSYRVKKGAVEVVISGNRPRRAMAEQAVRYAGYDGRVSDVGRGAGGDNSPAFMPLVSDNWNSIFSGADLRWDGTGEMPRPVREKLKRLVADVHAEGKRLRFWNLPKNGPGVWGPLLDAGVDLVNTDDLPGLAAYVRSRAEKTGGLN